VGLNNEAAQNQNIGWQHLLQYDGSQFGGSAPKVDNVTLSLLLFEGTTFLTVKHKHSVFQ
jgi:hypothetical protein